MTAPDTPDGATPPDVIERAVEVIEADWEIEVETIHPHDDAPYTVVAILATPEEIAGSLRDANLLAASSPGVTAAERDVIDAAEAWRRTNDRQGLPHLVRTNELTAAVDRLAAARKGEDA